MADWKKIVAYSLAWEFDRNKGYILLKLEKESESINLQIETPQELALVADILRNEKVVSYNDSRRAIGTNFISLT